MKYVALYLPTFNYPDISIIIKNGLISPKMWKIIAQEEVLITRLKLPVNY